MSINAAVLAMLIPMGRVLTLAVEVDVNGILALVSEVWAAALLVAAEILGILELLPHAAFLAVPLGVVRVVNTGALVSEKVVARLTDSVRVGLPDLGKGDVVRLVDHGVLELIPIPHLDHAFGGCVNICDTGFAVLHALENDPTIVLRLLGPSADSLIVLVIQGVEL